MQIRKTYTFDDLLLVPQYSEIESRKNVDISVKIKDYTFNHPYIPANMASIAGHDMCKFIVDTKGLAITHRFQSPQEQLDIFTNLNKPSQYFSISVGVKETDLELVKSFKDLGGEIITIDIAHGDSLACVDMCKAIKSIYNCLLIAGNVATSNAAQRLFDSGADVVKVGIGGGSLCSTRTTTGNGVPQMSAIMDVAKNLKENQYIISDGGIKKSSDAVKALCFSHMVMVGGVFAGTNETPGRVVYKDGKPFKDYNGSSTHKSNNIEGVKSWVPVKGPSKTILNNFIEGLQSGCSYQGVDNLTDLRDNPEFVEITNNGVLESAPHIHRQP